MVAANINGDRDHNTTLAGNLCRCTGYEPIVKAAKASENEKKPAWVEEDFKKLSHLRATAWLYFPIKIIFVI